MNSYIKRGRVFIENVRPQVDCGRYRVKAVVGDDVRVTADILRDGPDLLQAAIRYRGPSDRRWNEAALTHAGNDVWEGSFSPGEIGRFRYTIEAWTDHFATWRSYLVKRVEAGQVVDLELAEGAGLIEARLPSVPAAHRPVLSAAATAMRGGAAMRGEGDGGTETGGGPAVDARVAAALNPEVAVLMTRHSDRSGAARLTPALELTVDRERARFGSWYELFPRSTGTKIKHGTFRTAVKLLPDIARMGFDVLYIPPIHPIGVTFRKGRNNALKAGPDDVGVPWAIGSKDGGHKDVHPSLGTLQDFDYFVAEAGKLGLEVALDFAVNCSPDHPWVTEHPEWFSHRPDGSIKYAENPPKKYQDIYPINFDTQDKAGLWTELLAILQHWVDHGVTLFRVDNPHTKAFRFWEWAIEEIQRDRPDVLFLAEAFTRPKVMKLLAKLGFTQSYTYFTWRNHKQELTDYLTELSTTDMAEYFRPNFFVNTQDILHEYLQHGGPPAFKVRLVLAAMLSPTYGVYSGYELYERAPREPGSEEYLHSEKYELRPRDFSTPGNLRPYMTRINTIRAKHPALTRLTNLHFHHVDKEHLMAFSKSLPGSDSIVVVINLNPFTSEEGTVDLDLDVLGLSEHRPYEMHDLIGDTTYVWSGRRNYVRLDPQAEPAHVFRVGS